MNGETRQTAAADTVAGDLDQLALSFGLGSLQELRFLDAGMMNRNWRLTSDAGVFALKQLQDVPAVKARRSLETLTPLAEAGLPVCAPRPTESGEVLASIGAHTYCLLPWIEGTHRRALELTAAEVRVLGALVGEMHRALADSGLPEPGAVPRAKVVAPQAAVAEADQFLATISALSVRTPFDEFTSEALRRRKDLITRFADARPATEVPLGPVGWTHGDLQPLNILWDRGEVAAVLDWDRLGVRPYAEEVVRTAQVWFTLPEGRLDLERVGAFVAGYRGMVPLDDAALEDAEARLWWKRASDFWQLQWHYDKHDHGPDELWITGERLLAWWTDERAQVRASITAGG
ncbi:phosphotransferase [Streptomyces sp. NBC_01006]|uniref:phosphotransferase n=1 Tax=Streptomyces sp. NBC_01006 TaxID=2903716 RepID=UPI00386EEDDD|nr:phosphotransferase [Streptomyces sp. NBC_01006]